MIRKPDEQPRRVLIEEILHLVEQAAPPGRVELAVRLFEQSVELGVAVTAVVLRAGRLEVGIRQRRKVGDRSAGGVQHEREAPRLDRKSTRLNSSHEWISYAVFCLKKKKKNKKTDSTQTKKKRECQTAHNRG